MYLLQCISHSYATVVKHASHMDGSIPAYVWRNVSAIIAWFRKSAIRIQEYTDVDKRKNPGMLKGLDLKSKET